MARRRTRTPQPVKTGEGSWTVRWRAKVGDREVRHRRTFPTRREADDFIRDEWAANPGRDWIAADTPFSRYAEAWLAAVEVKPRTREGYAQALTHSLRYFGDRPVGEVTARDAREFIAYLKAQPTLRTARSVRWAWHPFRAVLALAVEDGALAANPAEAVAHRLPRPATHRDAEGNVVPKFTAHPLTPLEIDRLADVLAADGREPYDLMVRFLGNTGLRAGELAGLNVGDVTTWLSRDRWRGYVNVSRTRRKVRGGWVEDTPKSKRSVRRVVLPDHLAEAMHGYLANGHPRGDDATAPLWPNRKRGGYTHGERGRMVPGSSAHGDLNWSEPVEPGAFYRNVFRRAVEAAGLGATRLHDLRHSLAVNYLKAGGDIHRLSELLGHASYRITYDVYASHIASEEDAPHPMDSGVRRIIG